MRVNIYEEELLGDDRVKRFEKVTTQSTTGQVYSGLRIYFRSPHELRDTEADDRSAVTFWGSNQKIARLLREAAQEMDGNKM